MGRRWINGIPKIWAVISAICRKRLEMLPGTIAENISRFNPQAQDSMIIEAAQIAGVHEMILALPGGYSTPIGMAGQPLSGGQIQRLGLARAIYGIPRLIVLDEPNSNLDGGGDDALSAAILTLRARGSVVVVMAHRPCGHSCGEQGDDPAQRHHRAFWQQGRDHSDGHAPGGCRG